MAATLLFRCFRSRRSLAVLFTLMAAVAGTAAWSQTPAGLQLWLTNADRSQLLALQPSAVVLDAAPSTAPDVLTVDPAQRFQTIDGFGFAMTGGSAQLLHHMDAAPRHALLQQLFGRGPGELGISYLRVSIGASDMNSRVYTYDDLPTGATDPGLQHFSLAEDETDVIPVLREVLQIAPSLQILATPWTAPSWMKTNGLPKGGQLQPRFAAAYAGYFVRYLQGMRQAGIPIAVVTPQNEPLNANNTPSMVMEAAQEDAFVRDNLGPALAKAGLRTRIVLFDHNCDHPDYPLSILADPAAARFTDGSGFHLYAGNISAMSEVHNAYPGKNLYFTEQMVVEHTHDGVLEPVAQPVTRIVIGAMRNWSRTALLWNLAADPSFGPHTNDGGCPVCQGAITLDGNQVERNIALWTVAHASRFVPPGSVRVGSNNLDETLQDVGWATPQGKTVLLVSNTGTASRSFEVRSGKQHFLTALDPGSVGTYVWDTQP